MTFENRRLGRRIPDTILPAISYRAIRTAASDSFLAEAPPVHKAPVIPPTADHLIFLNNWKMLGNDQFGVCNAVAWANQRRLVTSKLGHTEQYPNLDQVYEFYKTQNPGFDPKSTQPESPDDGGMRVQSGLQHLVRNGGPDGVKAIAFASVDVKKIQDVHAALVTFGGLWLGIKVLKNNGSECDNKIPWTVSPSSTVVGGHAVLAGGYLPNVKFVTWGTTAELSQEFWSGIAGNSKLDNLVDEAWVVIWPEHIGTRSFMKGVDLQQLGIRYKALTGRDMVIPAAPFHSLYFVKVFNAESGGPEVHRADSATSYSTFDIHTGTPATFSDARTGTWVVENKDMYYIKTKDPKTKSIEVHRLPQAHIYSQFDGHNGSGFGAADADNGTFTIDNGDLWFVKTKNVPNNHVEVHMADHQNRFATVSFHATTAFEVGDAANGYFTVRGGDLYLIKTRNTQSGKVEVYCADAGSEYKTISKYPTWFDPADDYNGTWDIGSKDLYFIKTKNCGSGRVEVHIATAKSSYQAVSHYASVFGEADGANGFWCV